MNYNGVVDVSIIMVNYKTARLIRSAVDSVIKKSIEFSYEIIVVDNDSKDNSKKIFEELFGEGIKYIGLSENIGFGRANNEGIKIAKGRYIFFLNPDTELINNAIKILIDYIENKPDVGIVGGNLYTADLKPGYSYCRFLPGVFTDEISLLSFNLSKYLINQSHHNLTQKPLNVGGISGADLLIRRSILEEVGYFDPQYFMYYEDTDLNWRVKKAGYKVVNVPAAKIIHLDSQSFTFKETKMRFSLESRAKYYAKVKGIYYLKLPNRILRLAINFNIIIRLAIGRDSTFFKNYKTLVNELYFKN